MKKRLLLLGVLLLALFLRLSRLSDFPAGFTADEAAQGYTAYSILKTGRDEWGVKLPLNPRFFGDFKPPLLTYLMIPSIAIFGLSEFSVRLPNVLLGSFSVLVVYFLSKELIKEKKELSNYEWVPLLSTLFLAVSPWHIGLSRAAFEMNLTTFFLPLGVLFFLKGINSAKFMVLSALFLGLNLFTYHSAKVVTPLILIFLFFWKKAEILPVFRSKDKKYLFIAATVFLICGAIIIDGFFKGAGTRASDIGIFSGKYEQLADNKHFACSQGLPIPIARFFYNKLEYSLSEFVKNYLSYTSSYFLFAQGAGEATYGMIPGYGVLYLIEIFFVSAALYFLFKEKENGYVLLFFWILVSPIPAALARGVGYHASRVAVMMPAIQIFSAFGAVRLLNLLKKRRDRNFVFLVGSLILVFSFLSFLQTYFFLAPRINAPKMGYGWRETMSYLLEKKNQNIIVSRSFSEPQTFVMFYGLFDPVEVQKETITWQRYQKEGKYFVDQMGSYSLGNYIFRNFSFPEDWQKKETIFVGSEGDFLVQEQEIIKMKSLGKIKEEKVISFPDGKPAFKIIII